MIKVNLNKMTEADFKALLDNSTVMDKLIQRNSEVANFVVGEWLTMLKGVCDYSLSDSSQYNYISVNNPYKFLGSVLDAGKEYYIGLSDEDLEKIEKVVDVYENTELSAENEDKLNATSKRTASKLAKAAEAEYDSCFDEGRLLEEMKHYDILLDIYGEDAYYNRDDNKIYRICAD